MPPVAPMLAKAQRQLPEGPGWLYEPKWDGFRCVVFRDGDEVELGSRNERPLTRYFPEVVAAVRRGLPDKCVLDGEIVIAGQSGLDFDALLNRIHPADSRVRTLAEQTPASFVAFDLLAVDGEDLRPAELSQRRGRLTRDVAGGAGIHVTPATEDIGAARDWFTRFEGAGLDGVVAKRLDSPYVEGERVMIKVKHERTADCVVAGFRWHKTGPIVGSLLLGLYDASGQLHHVGVCAAFTAARRRELVDELAPYRVDVGDDHPWSGWQAATTESRRPGGHSRWNAGKDLSWEPLRPELVCEVAYDHLQGDRFRHATQFRRWRTDRTARSCTYDQLDTPIPAELGALLPG